MVYMLVGKLSANGKRGINLNKQRFLTELKRLLVFMTDSDRELTIAQYAERFEAVGEEGEAALLESLGSPTKVAISLSRGYEPGSIASEQKQKKALRAATEAARAVKSRREAEEDELPEHLREFEEDTLAPSAALGEELADDDPVAMILRSLDQDFADEEADGEEENGEPEEDFYEEPAAPTIVYKRLHRPMPVGLGASVLTLVLLVAGLPLAALTLALIAVALLPGAAGILAAGLSAIAALWCVEQLANALLLFGLAFLLLGLALVLLWLGLRLDIRLVKLYARLVYALCDAFLGKKEAVE